MSNQRLKATLTGIVDRLTQLVGEKQAPPTSEFYRELQSILDSLKSLAAEISAVKTRNDPKDDLLDAKNQSIESQQKIIFQFEDYLARVLDMLSRLADGEFTARVQTSDEYCHLSAITDALNLLGEDLSSVVKRERTLRDRLEQEVKKRTAELNEQLETIREQQKTILDLSVPVLKVWEGVLVLPLIGAIDTQRAALLTQNLLSATAGTEAQVAILDLSGVPFVDTAVAKHFIDAIRAVNLLGVEAILTGLTPENVQNIVKLGVDLNNVDCRGSLFAGLQRAIHLRRLREKAGSKTRGRT